MGLIAYVAFYLATCWVFSFNAYEKSILKSLIRR